MKTNTEIREAELRSCSLLSIIYQWYIIFILTETMGLVYFAKKPIKHELEANAIEFRFFLVTR